MMKYIFSFVPLGTCANGCEEESINAAIKGPFLGKWHIFVLALIDHFECLNE